MKLIMENFKKFINEEEDAMRGADRPGAGIEDVPQPEGEEPIDVLMDVKARLAGMSEEELMQLAADLDGGMVTALRHILSDKMYAPTGEFDSLPQIGDDPRDQSPLEEMHEGYGPGGVRGSSYSGFPPAQARALAKQLATMSSRKSLSYGDEGKLNDYLRQQKYSTSREAKDDIIKYLVGNGFGYRADYT